MEAGRSCGVWWLARCGSLCEMHIIVHSRYFRYRWHLMRRSYKTCVTGHQRLLVDSPVVLLMLLAVQTFFSSPGTLYILRNACDCTWSISDLYRKCENIGDRYNVVAFESSFPHVTDHVEGHLGRILRLVRNSRCQSYWQ
jgi:hypothetical protein